MLLNGDCLRGFEKNQLVDNAPNYENYFAVDDHNDEGSGPHLLGDEWYSVGILFTLATTATKGALTQRTKLETVSTNCDELEDELMDREHT